MLTRFNPIGELPVCQIKIGDLSINSNNTSDKEGENDGVSLNHAREWVRKGGFSNPLIVMLGKEYMGLTVENAEEMIQGLQSMVDFLKS